MTSALPWASSERPGDEQSGSCPFFGPFAFMPTPGLRTEAINDQEIFAVGRWNGDEYSEADLDAIVEAHPKVGFKPPIKLGHSEEQKLLDTEGLPAAGWVENLRRIGGKLVADFKGVPKKIADLIRAGGYKRKSAEIYWGYSPDGNGKAKFPRVLKAVALLGGEIPAVTSLDEILALYERFPGGPAHAFKDKEKGNEFRSYNIDTTGPISPMYPIYPKKNKVTVNYKDLTIEGAERCSTCKFYMFRSCALVEGEIAPEAYCDLYEARNYQSVDENRLLSKFREMLDSALSIFKGDGRDDLKSYTIEKRGDEYCLIAGSGKVLGCHKTRGGAEAQERAVQANKNELLISARQMEEICPPCAEKMLQRNFSAIRLLPMMSEGGVLTYAFPGGMPQEAFEALCERFSPDEGFRTRCMDSSAGAKADDPGAFCNSLKIACKDQALLSSGQPAKEYAMEVREKNGQFCVMDGEKTVKCYPTRKEAEEHVEKMSKGGPTMDEKKYQEEQARLTAERDAADKKAKDYEKQLNDLKTANEAARSKESEALTEVKKLKRERHDDQVGAWISEQKRAGKLGPVEEPRVTAILQALYEDQRTVTFSQKEGEETKESLADAVKAFIASRPSIFKELSEHEGEPETLEGEAGDQVDQKTKAHMAKHGMKTEQYADAMKAVLTLPENEELARKWVRMNQ